MTNSELEIKLHGLVREERKITEEILGLIREADRRRLYLERGHGSLYDWLTREYGYSHGAAHRRIQSARLVEAVPEAKEKLGAGSVNLTTLAQVQSAVRKKERASGKKVSAEMRRALVKEIEGKSSRETEKILAANFPEQAPGRESLRAVNGEETKLTVVLGEEAVENLKRVKELLAHTKPEASFAEVIAHLAKDFVDKKDPLKKSAAGQAGCQKTATLTPGQKREVLQKAKGQCEFVDPITKRRCMSRFQLEVDHIIPKARNGTNARENLRCLCRAHNFYEAEKKLGKRCMEQYRWQPQAV